MAHKERQKYGGGGNRGFGAAANGGMGVWGLCHDPLSPLLRPHGMTYKLKR